ncbi:MAG TPA: class I SAM-dependent rRNA methyltransferase [Phycisphaerae bacterium]|nr:class I SAM-dependent rRNA methyltransferase [Phycisphaerae bacterium]HRY70718.1 class I SAM-dependent rRNA methyltransferase [Phycisphaerae bacterium]
MMSNPPRDKFQPTISASQNYPYPWVRLRSAAASPFIYRRMVDQVAPEANPGDVVVVYDRKGDLFGHGFYHDRSQIALRMISYAREPVDDAFFAARIDHALAWRKRLIGSDPGTDVYRLVHAEGDLISGLIAERYADWIAIEVFSLGVFRRLDLFKRLLGEQTGVSRFVVRADDRVERLEGFHVPPEASDVAPRTITVRENGIRFRVDLRAGHKTGFFCDQRENRRRLASLCDGLDVLDVCCYTGGFGVYAAKLGGAASVTAVDLDEEAIELAKANTKLNEVRIQHIHADAFTYLRQMQTNGRQFDAVVLDPPKFVPGRDDYQEGSRKYLDLNTLGISVLKPGGLLLTCSCSGLVGRDDFLGMVRAAAGRLGRPLQILDQTGAGPDHPIMAHCPESGYLKAIWARVL